MATKGWSNICLYCTEDLKEGRQYLKYCSQECNDAFRKTDFKALSAECEEIEKIFGALDYRSKEEFKDNFRDEGDEEC